MGRQTHEISAVQKRHDPDARWEKIVVELLDFVVQGRERRIGIGAFPQQHDAFNDVIGIDDPSLVVMDRLPDPAQTNLWSLDDRGDISNVQRRAILRLEQGRGDVGSVRHESDGADIDCLLPALDETPAGVDVVRGQRLLHLADAQTVLDEPIGIDEHLVLAGDPAKTHDIDDVRHRLELLLENPVFERFQLHEVVLRVGTRESVKVNLTNRAVIGPELRVHRGRERHLREALEDLLPIHQVVGLIVEDHGDD